MGLERRITSTRPVGGNPTEIGIDVGPYRLGAELGAGGSARVFEAHGANGPVALKVLTLDGASARRRFRREVEILSSLQGARIVKLLDANIDSAPPWVAMELLRGETLAQRLRRAGALAVGEVLGVAVRLAAALRSVHAAGVVHADVKPANIMIAPGGALKLIDLGTARWVRAEVEHGAAIEGSAAYMAPEQADGTTPDERTDVFAFGVVLFEMLVGRRPRDVRRASDHLSVLSAGTLWTPRAEQTLASRAPAPLACVVRECLQPRPDDRPASGSELLAMLRSPALARRAA